MGQGVWRLGVVIWAAAWVMSEVGAAAEDREEETVRQSESDQAQTGKRARLVSPHLAEALAEKMPAFEPKTADQKGKAQAEAVDDRPANGIVRLPRYVVREPKVPSERDVRSPRGLEVHAMNKYMGDSDGITRGVLNRFTLGGVWDRFVKGRIPLIGRFDWAVTLEGKALDRYYDDEARKELLNLVRFDAAAQAVGSKKHDGQAEKSAPAADATAAGRP